MASTDQASAARDALRAIDFAQARMQMASRLEDGALVACADAELRSAVLAALDSGVSWGTIGRSLGLARGNAYQKYRRRSMESTTAGS